MRRGGVGHGSKGVESHLQQCLGDPQKRLPCALFFGRNHRHGCIYALQAGSGYGSCEAQTIQEAVDSLGPRQQRYAWASGGDKNPAPHPPPQTPLSPSPPNASLTPSRDGRSEAFPKVQGTPPRCWQSPATPLPAAAGTPEWSARGASAVGTQTRQKSSQRTQQWQMKDGKLRMGSGDKADVAITRVSARDRGPIDSRGQE